ncbi:hypothetical protein E1B28_010812 [Marasmius oreades]|uniref:C2H2-type domain-containing protein n=1 Tax=Marasmius oreades TaxID=181124 RepID=A0A9P7UPC2_9AGAR|nr:uncharacterized protein E1B28_010812 [Marasmius oreades]KAG7089103.1 hypothetical protein E1B28_010812 [Marasmius oreades]
MVCGQIWVIHRDSDLIMDHLTPASLNLPFSKPNSPWDFIGMPLHKGLQEDYKIRDMNRVALLEKDYCSSFFCCDIRLSGFHELLEHIEDAHFVLTKDKNGKKRYLYQPIGVSNVGRLLSPLQHQHPYQRHRESCCSPFDADHEFEEEFEFADNGYTDPFTFCGYHEDESQPSSPSPSPSPTISSASLSSSSVSSPMTSPSSLSLPTWAPAPLASPPPRVPKATAVAPNLHVPPTSPARSNSSVPLIAPIPLTPNHYDLLRHGRRHYESKRACSSPSRARIKQISSPHHTTSTIIAAAAGTGSRKRGPSSGDREKMYQCPTTGCTKAYLNPNGLKYHCEKGKCNFDS